MDKAGNGSVWQDSFLLPYDFDAALDGFTFEWPGGRLFFFFFFSFHTGCLQSSYYYFTLVVLTMCAGLRNVALLAQQEA